MMRQMLPRSIYALAIIRLEAPRSQEPVAKNAGCPAQIVSQNTLSATLSLIGNGSQPDESEA